MLSVSVLEFGNFLVSGIGVGIELRYLSRVGVDLLKILGVDVECEVSVLASS